MAGPVYDVALTLAQKVVGHNHTMSEDELKRAGRALFGAKFAGVFGADETAKMAKAVNARAPYAVVNEGDRKSGGWHWLAVIRDPVGGGLAIHDSYGRRVRGTAGERIKTLSTTVEQTLQETNCGQRSLAALILDWMVTHVTGNLSVAYTSDAAVKTHASGAGPAR